jgi:hypothetical protein
MKTRYALFIVIFAVSILIGIQAVELADANPFGLAKQINAPSDAKPPIVSIDSPQNETCYSDTFNISFSVKAPQYFSRSVIVDVFYTIDNETVTVPHELWTLTQGPGISQYSTSIIAPSLPAGNHSLKIRAQGGSYDFYNFFLIDGYSQIYFVIRRAPSFELLTDQSTNITFSSFPLNFTVDQPTSWLGYSLDDLANVTIGGNSTLTRLSAGNHSLVVYGNNTFGDMAKSETINFTAKEPETSLALTVIAPVAIAIIISSGLLVYLRRKRIHEAK